MKRILSRIFMVAAAAAFSITSAAQEPLGPGEGKPIIEGSFGGDIATLNPILVNDGASENLTTLLYPYFIGYDPETAVPRPGADGALAQSWMLAEDNRTLTVYMRDDRTWSDGTPITSADIKYAYDAIMSGEVDTPFTSFLSAIESVETPDDHTVVIRFDSPDCTAIDLAATIPVVPAHHFQTIFPTFADMNESPLNLSPQVTAGPFKFGNFRSGEQVTLLADQNYPDSPAGYVVPEGYVLKTVTDLETEYEQFLNGDITVMYGTPENRNLEIALRAGLGQFRMIDRPTSGWQILLFNMADPADPQPGIGATGEPVAQNPHPVLGNLAVRQAISHAVDYAALNTGAFAGLGIPLGGPMTEISWAHNAEIEPYTFDLELANQLLDEAGWLDSDGDAETPRVASERVGTAEAGTPLTLELTIFTGNEALYSSAVLLQDQLKQAGIGVRLELVEFNAAVDQLVGQTYDMLMIYWGVGANRPQDMYDMLGLEGDLPGGGYNTGSFYNAEFERVMQDARSLSGCDISARKALYDRAQEIIHDNVPYYLVNSEYARILVQNSVENFEPKTSSVTWNLPAWSIRQTSR